MQDASCMNDRSGLVSLLVSAITGWNSCPGATPAAPCGAGMQATNCAALPRRPTCFQKQSAAWLSRESLIALPPVEAAWPICESCDEWRRRAGESAARAQHAMGRRACTMCAWYTTRSLALLPGVAHARERIGDARRVVEKLGAASLHDEQVHLFRRERRCGSRLCAARAAHVTAKRAHWGGPCQQSSLAGAAVGASVPFRVIFALRFEGGSVSPDEDRTRSSPAVRPS